MINNIFVEMYWNRLNVVNHSGNYLFKRKHMNVHTYTQHSQHASKSMISILACLWKSHKLQADDKCKTMINTCESIVIHRHSPLTWFGQIKKIIYNVCILFSSSFRVWRRERDNKRINGREKERTSEMKVDIRRGVIVGMDKGNGYESL